MKKQKKNKGSVLVVESAYNAQNAQIGLVMLLLQKKKFYAGNVLQQKINIFFWENCLTIF